MECFEVNFDGLVGNTHNYAGLSFGNVASTSHAEAVSRPKEAALQGLQKMLFLHKLGLKQAVLPPQERPDVGELRRRGFQGSDEEVIKEAFRKAPDVLAVCSSASSMWTANAMTVAPGVDTSDGKTHLMVANLINKTHRAIEWPTTKKVLEKVFSKEEFFVHHDPVIGDHDMGDEGAANHTRFCTRYEEPGMHLFVYGRYAKAAGMPEPTKFPARQTFESSEKVAKDLKIDPMRVVLAQQNPEVIDAGVFHNDVISVGNQQVFLVHEEAFVETPKLLEDLNKKFLKLTGKELVPVLVKSDEVSVEASVKSYLFNSQLVSLPHGGMAIIAPKECEETNSVKAKLDKILLDASNPINDVHYLDLRQSMQNGGGPACLRNRVVLTEEQISSLGARVVFDSALYAELVAWVEKHYRDELAPGDIGDPQLLKETRTALDELCQILGLGAVYPFQA